jgi:ribonuclease Z
VSPEARERRIEATWAGLPVRGVSVAGRETWFHLPTFRLAFDLGRCPTELVSVPNVFLSHAHLDHGAGLPYWSSQRKLLRLGGGVVRTHPAAVEGWRRIVALHEELEGVATGARIEGIEPGTRVSLRRDLEVEAFEADHRVPTLAFVASELRNRLRADLAGRSEADVREAVTRGETVSERVTVPLVAYSGDTAAGIFSRAPRAFFTAKVLLLECSFVEERDRDRSKEWKHLHVDEIAEHADLFENEVVVLTHLTLRTSPGEIRRLVKQRLPARLAARAVPFLPE